MAYFVENWTPVSGSREVITVAGTAMGLTIPGGASGCRIQVIGDATNTAATKAVRVTFEGTTPTTTTIGFIFGDLDIIELPNKSAMQQFKAIQAEAAKTNTLEVVYYYTNQ